MTDSAPRTGESDRLLLNADRNPNSTGARLIGIASARMGSNLARIASDIANEIIKTLIVFGEDVTKAGLGAEFAGQTRHAHRQRHPAQQNHRDGALSLARCAHAEKRGSFVNVKGRVQRFMQNVQPKGDARPEWEFLHELAQGVTGREGASNIEGLFNQMAAEVPAFNGLTWAALGDLGVTVPI